MASDPAPGLTHFDAEGRAQMVDVTDKPVTDRIAIAEAYVEMLPETLALILEGRAEKGDVLGTARLAGIMGAKRTSDLIPLCHPLPLSKVALDLAAAKPESNGGRSAIRIEATVRTTGRTGVEMEALTAVTIAALTVYDMAKAVEKTMRIEGIRLLSKEGGKSGRFTAT